MVRHERRRQPRYTDRLRSLRDRVDRLVAEARLIRAEVGAFASRDELDTLRRMLRKQRARSPWLSGEGTK
jgi:hypothetical protein